MSEEMIPFQFESHNVRVQLDEHGEPWWVLAECCEVLGLTNARETVKRLDTDDVRKSYVIDAQGRTQDSWLINESGLYTLILRSNKPAAKAFKHWLTSEVLPAIRKTGSYTPPSALPADPGIHAMLLINEQVRTLLLDQAALRTEVAAVSARQDAIDARRPPTGKLLIQDWIAQQGKPRLYGQLWTSIKSRCREIEDPQMFRPEGMDWPLPYYSPYTIATAYQQVTDQLTFITEARQKHSRQGTRFPSMGRNE